MFKAGIRSIQYVFKEIIFSNPLLLFIYLLLIILKAFEPYIFTFYSKYILDAIELRTSYLDMVIITVIAFSSAAITSFLKKVLDNLKTPQVIKSTIAMKRKITIKNLSTEYSNIENPIYLNHHEKAQNTLNNVSKGFQGVIHSTFGLLEGVAALIIYLLILRNALAGIILYGIFFMIIVVSVIKFLILNWARKFEYDKSEEQTFCQRKSTYFFNTMCDFSYGKEIRIFGFASKIMDHFISAKNDEIHISKMIKLKFRKVSRISELLNAVLSLSIYVYFISLFMNGLINIGDFSLLTLSTTQVTQKIRDFLEQCSNLMEQSYYMEELKEFLLNDDDINQKYAPSFEIAPKNVIEIRDISFRYPGSKNYIFENFSLHLAEGEKLALIGYNGAGKSTLVKLICGLFYPEKGEILLNGVDTMTMPKEECYKLYSTVFQDIFIFAFSIAENISLKEKSTDYVKLEQCIDKAGLSEKVESLTKGYHTAMSKVLQEDGIELSGGEKQKLVHARAYYKDAPITVMDEPTAAMDPIAEYELYQNFNRISLHKTSLYISHRLSFAKFCDKIVFLEGGKIVESGTHDELMKQDGAYMKFYQLQSRYYKDNEGRYE